MMDGKRLQYWTAVPDSEGEGRNVITQCVSTDVERLVC